MCPHPVVQLASQQSADQIAALGSLTTPDVPYTAASVIEALQDPAMTVAVVTTGQTVLAVGVMEVGEGLAYLQMLAVHPDHRRKSLASAVIEWLEKHAAAAGATESFVQCLSSDEPALCLYTGRGYVPMVFKNSGSLGGESGVLLKKDLSQCLLE